jgi:hypothetical protein
MVMAAQTATKYSEIAVKNQLRVVTGGTATFEARIGDLTVIFTAAILKNLYSDILLGHNFLVDNEVTWDYTSISTSIIHLGSHRRTTAC